MVRLECFGLWFLSIFSSDFNSLMVRLESSTVLIGMQYTFIFQFLNGAIGVNFEKWHYYDWCNFNSLMVRLELPVPTSSVPTKT